MMNHIESSFSQGSKEPPRMVCTDILGTPTGFFLQDNFYQLVSNPYSLWSKRDAALRTMLICLSIESQADNHQLVEGTWLIPKVSDAMKHRLDKMNQQCEPRARERSEADEVKRASEKKSMKQKVLNKIQKKKHIPEKLERPNPVSLRKTLIACLMTDTCAIASGDDRPLLIFGTSLRLLELVVLGIHTGSEPSVADAWLIVATNTNQFRPWHDLRILFEVYKVSFLVVLTRPASELWCRFLEIQLSFLFEHIVSGAQNGKWKYGYRIVVVWHMYAYLTP
ncbi:hypothetical protein Tco_1103586 [Tanacetum coccineum]